jgi:hypothetical protein
LKKLKYVRIPRSQELQSDKSTNNSIHIFNAITIRTQYQKESSKAFIFKFIDSPKQEAQKKIIEISKAVKKFIEIQK